MEENNINNSEKTPYEEPQIKVTDEAFYEDKTSGQQEDEAVPHIEVVGEQWQKGAEAEKDDGKQEEAKEEGTQKTPREIVKTIVRLFKNFNRLTRILIIVAAVTAVGIGIYSMQQRAKHKKIVRTITQTVVEVRKIKEFCTANYQEEMVVSTSRKKFMKQEDLAIIAKGTVRVGFNLATMTTELTSDTSIIVNIPHAIVLDVITNPSDFETFQEDGHWDHELVTSYKNLAREMILNHAKEDGIMEDAEARGKEKIAELFYRLGFREVTVNVFDPKPAIGDSSVPSIGGTAETPEVRDSAL